MKVRRVVVKMDAEARSPAVLAAAVALADKLQAELVGLFVEDANLLHFAAFPFTCEVCFPSATRREVDTAAMQRMLRGLAEDARKTLALAAGGSAVRWSFEITRGSAAGALLAAVTDADLVIASIQPPQVLERIEGVRVVLAGDAAELFAALEGEQPGAIVLAGSDVVLIGETLRGLLAMTA